MRSPRGARNVAEQLHRAIDYIARSAKGSVPTDIRNVRVKWVNRYHYKIFYEVADGVITLLHIRHTSRKHWEPEPALPGAIRRLTLALIDHLAAEACEEFFLRRTGNVYSVTMES